MIFKHGGSIKIVICPNCWIVQGVHTDTLGTHDRLLLLVPNQDFVARVIYQPCGFIAEDLEALILKQIWGWKGALCVFDPETVLFSEQITGL